MSRLWLVLLLSLSLWPSPAPASPVVRGSEPDSARGRGFEPPHEVLRSVGGLELLRGLGTRTSDPDGGEGSAHPRLRPGGWPLPAPTRVAPAFPAGVDVCVPHCERLPYHATAPPSPR